MATSRTLVKPERTERLEARITKKQKEFFRRAAEMQGRSLSDFVVKALSDAATEVIEKDRIITLTMEEQATVMKALLNPPAPGAKLRAAVKRYRKVMGS